MTSSPIANNKNWSVYSKSHGQNDKPRISKSKTTSTARVTGTSGKTKSVNVEVRKKWYLINQINKIAEELAFIEAAKEQKKKARVAQRKTEKQTEKEK